MDDRRAAEAIPGVIRRPDRGASHVDAAAYATAIPADNSDIIQTCQPSYETFKGHNQYSNG